MFRVLVSSLFLTLAHTSVGFTYWHAQTFAMTPGWEKVSVCQIRFLIPKNLKNQHAKGIDSCVAEFHNGTMRLAIDAGSFGGDIAKAKTMLDFTEEFAVIDGKKAQLIT